MGNDSRRGLLLYGLLLLLGRAVPLAAQTCASPSIFPAAGGTFSGTTTGTGSVAGSCGSSLSSPEWVFSWTPATSGVATIQLCGAGTTFDTVLYMRVGSCAGAEVSTGTAACGGAVGCNDDCAGCVNASGLARASKLTPTVTGGQTYIIVVDGFGTASRGNFTLTVTAPSGGSTTTTTPGATTTTTTTTLYRPPSYPTNLQVKTISCGSTPTVQLTWNASTPGTATLQGYAVYLWNGQQFAPDQCNTGGCPGGPTHSYSCCTGSPNAGILYINGNFPCAGGPGSLCTFTETLDFPGWPFYAVVAFDNSGPSGFSPSPPTCGAPDIGGNGVCGPGLFNGCTPYPCFQCTYNGTTPNTTSWCDPTVAQKCGDCSPCVNPTTTTTTTTITGTTTTLASWAQRFGGSGNDTGFGVARDAAGNVAWTGSFHGTVSFGGSSFTSGPNVSMVVVKQTPSGSYLWSAAVAGPGNSLPQAVAVDSNGDVLVTGSFNNTVNFGDGPVTNTSSSGTDIFVAKYAAATGALLWKHTFGDIANSGFGVVCGGNGVAVDSGNNVLLTGSFQGVVNFGGSNLSDPSLTTDVFVAKFNAAGIHQWSKNFTNSALDIGKAISTDSSGNVAVVGYFNGAISFNGSGGPFIGGAPNGQSSAFVAEFTSSGAYIWQKAFYDTNTVTTISADANGVACDSGGNVIVTGAFGNTVDFGGGIVTGAGQQDVFVAKYSSTGVYAWAHAYGGSAAEAGYAVAVGPSDSLFVTGTFFLGNTAPVGPNFGSGVFSSAGQGDIFVAKFTSGGGAVWSHPYGGTQNDIGHALAVDAGGNVLVTGNFAGTAAFGTQTLVSNAGSADICLIKLTSGGGL